MVVFPQPHATTFLGAFPDSPLSYISLFGFHCISAPLCAGPSPLLLPFIISDPINYSTAKMHRELFSVF